MPGTLPIESASSTPNVDLDWLNARYANSRIRIGPCDVGLGVFAQRDLAAGETLLTLSGPIIDFAETRRQGPRECMAIQIGPDRYLDTQPPGVFVNHSCQPNSGIRRDKYLVALRPIFRDEEIRYDYSTTMEEDSFVMPCCCGQAACRHWIRDFSTLPATRRRFYLAQDVVMRFIREKLAISCAILAL